MGKGNKFEIRGRQQVIFNNRGHIFLQSVLDRLITSSKARFPQKAIVQFTASSLFLSDFLYWLKSSSLSSHHYYSSLHLSVKTCFKSQFLGKLWPIQLIFLRFIHVEHSSPHWIFVILHFTQNRSIWSSRPPLASNFKTLQSFLIYSPKFPGFSTIILRSECIIFLVSSFNLDQISWGK